MNDDWFSAIGVAMITLAVVLGLIGLAIIVGALVFGLTAG